MQVAEITKDVLYEKWNKEGGEYNSTSHAGKEFHYDAMLDWWGWDDLPTESDWIKRFSKVKFELYDDDDELYYEGWLINDDQCVVQDFVKTWAERDSGCTTILVKKDGKFVQEIG